MESMVRRGRRPPTSDDDDDKHQHLEVEAKSKPKSKGNNNGSSTSSSLKTTTFLALPFLLTVLLTSAYLLLFFFFPNYLTNHTSSSYHPDPKDDSATALINLDHGDPVMFEPFWKNSGDRATVVISGWQTMSYFSDPSQLCWFLEPRFATQVRRLHRLVGNAVPDDRHIVVGVGSTQLIHAVFFALSSSAADDDNPHSVPIVSAAPYYSMYSGIANLLKSNLFHWAGDTSSFKSYTNSSSFIEIVCSPNNPDGAIRHAMLRSSGGNWVHDFAYYWPQYTPIRGPADEDIMLFTVSKATGHAGTRIGWALVRDANVARKMVKFIEMNSIGVSKDSQIRAARILQVVSDGYELPESSSKGPGRLFQFSRRLLADRWQRLREAVEVSGRFSLPQFTPEFCEFTKETAETYPAFAWLRCDDKSIEDCESFFKSIKVLTRSGRHFGAGPEYVRISMLDRARNFDIFINRISSVGLG